MGRREGGGAGGVGKHCRGEGGEGGWVRGGQIGHGERAGFAGFGFEWRLEDEKRRMGLGLWLW